MGPALSPNHSSACNKKLGSNLDSSQETHFALMSGFG